MASAIIPVPVDDPLQLAWEDRNDLGNAERLKRLSRGLLLWVEDIGWLAYDGKRWSTRDGELRANQLAHEVARHIDAEAAALDAVIDDEGALAAAIPFIPRHEDRKTLAEERVVALRKHAVLSGDASRTAAMLKQARTLMPARREDFDKDPLALNLQNGTLRFFQKQGGGWAARLDPHEPNDRLMQISNFIYDEKADCPEWKERMRLVQPNKDGRALLQQRFGYILTGLTSEQKWFIDQGRGGDGKSLTNTVIAEQLGDYYRHADIASFLKTGMQRSGADHSADLSRLAGDIRMVVCDEPDRNATWNGTRLKQVTGSKVTARGSGAKETIEYYPRWKLIVEVNPLPAVPSDDDGFWRRVVPIPWEYQFDKGGVASEPFELLVERFCTKEGSGILNWMIAGALKWLETRRLPMSAAATEFLANYRQSASPIGEWIGDRCDTSDRASETASGALYADFKTWCEAAGIEKVPTQTAFGRFLRDRHHMERKDGRGNRFRRGIKLKPDWTEQGLGAAAPAPADQGQGAGGWGAAQPLGPQEDVRWDDAP